MQHTNHPNSHTSPDGDATLRLRNAKGKAFAEAKAVPNGRLTPTPTPTVQDSQLLPVPQYL